MEELPVFFFSLNAVKLGSYGSKRKHESIKTFLFSLLLTLMPILFLLRTRLEKYLNYGLSFRLAALTFFLPRATACLS